MEQQQVAVEAKVDEISELQSQIEELEQRIAPLTAQLKPLQDQIRDLKRRQQAVRDSLRPVMKQQDIKKINADRVNIRYKPETKKMIPMKDVWELALDAYFKEHNLQLNAQEVVAFVHNFRKTNRVQTDAISICRVRAKPVSIAIPPAAAQSDDMQCDTVEPFKY